MIEKFLTAQEYDNYFVATLNRIRNKIVNDIPKISNFSILDVATGYGYFAIAIAKYNPHVKIIAIDISEEDINKARINIELNKLTDCIQPIQMDATKISFSDESFDMVVNFLGLEDIYMTRGRKGIALTFSRVCRVLKSNGYFCFVAMPSDEMETEAQKIEGQLFSFICKATWLTSQEYESMLKKTGFRLLKKKNYYTGKKLTPEQARNEIQFACDNVPKIYRIKTPTSRAVWNKFGNRIKKYGVGHYSKLVLYITKKYTGLYES
jgi:ubiquinone/menaquinone biosynthesis C-methylase UbiE